MKVLIYLFAVVGLMGCSPKHFSTVSSSQGLSKTDISPTGVDDLVKDDLVKDDLVNDDLVKDDLVKDDLVKDDLVNDDLGTDNTDNLITSCTAAVPFFGSQLSYPRQYCDQKRAEMHDYLPNFPACAVSANPTVSEVSNSQVILKANSIGTAFLVHDT